MSDSNGGCVFAVILYSAYAAVVVGSGFLAWEWTEPDNFWSALGFLIVWALLGKAGQFVVSLIIAGISSMLE